MGAQMNIKSDEAYAIASGLAKTGGASLTEIVLEALRALKRTRESDSIYASALEICRDTAPRLAGTQLSLAHGDLLYDDRGLPT